jgi:nitroreductase
MELTESLRLRRSTRAFLKDPIPKDILVSILSDASNAPSAINMQPWEVTLVSGGELKRLSAKLIKAYKERSIGCSPGSVNPLPDKFIKRASQSVEEMSFYIKEMGSDFKTYINEGSLRFYDAPTTALIFVDESFPPERMADIGSFMAYFVLACSGRGLGSCPIGLIKAYEDEVKDHLNVPESKNLIVSIALGKPDPNASINRFRSTRTDQREWVRWIE